MGQRNTMSTPALIRIQDKTQLIYHAGGIRGIDPATGDVLWWCLAPTSLSSPVYGGGLLYADESAAGAKGAAIDPTGKGDVSRTHVKWQTRIGSASGSSGIIVGGHVYRLMGRGGGWNSSAIGCWALETGALVHEEEKLEITSSASPVATGDGRIYFASPGKSYVIQAGPMFKILAVNDLHDGPDYSSAAV